MRIEKEVYSVSEGLSKLLNKYNITPPSYELEGHTLKIADETIPLFPWRNEPRFREMKKLYTNGVIGNLSSIRAMRTTASDNTLADNLYREVDLCIWWAGMKLVNVFAVVNGPCANVIMRFENKADVILEVASTLPDGSEPIERHEFYTDHGLTTDQAIDTLIKQHSLYAFIEGQPARTFTDNDFELYGLAPDQTALVRTAFSALSGEVSVQKAQKDAAYVNQVVDAIMESARTQTVISLEEGIV